MRYTILLFALAAMISPGAISSADAAPAAAGSAPKAAAPAASAPAASRAAPAQSYQYGTRRGWFSGRSAKNWYLNRGTPDDNSTIPTPVNRNPKGRPKNSPVFFPKNM